MFTFCHCVKSVQIRSCFWFVLSRIRTEYGEIHRIEIRIRTLFTYRVVESEKNQPLNQCSNKPDNWLQGEQ